MAILEKNLILLDPESRSKEELIRLMSDRLLSCGAVKDSFADAVLARELLYPTGLPTEPYCVAIPHTEAAHVNEIRIAVARLQEPVMFQSIELTGENLPVKLVFLQALRDSNQHLSFTKALMTIIRDADRLKAIEAAADIDELFELLKDLNV